LDDHVKRLLDMIQRLEALMGEGARLREDVAREMVRRLSVDLKALETQLYPPEEPPAPPSKKPSSSDPESG
jgi:hypothetical protein